MEQLLDTLCEKTGYSRVYETPAGNIKVKATSSSAAAPYIEGDIEGVLRRLIRMTRKTFN